MLYLCVLENIDMFSLKRLYKILFNLAQFGEQIFDSQLWMKQNPI